MSIKLEELEKFEAVKIDNAWYWKKDERIYEAYILENRVIMNDVTDAMKSVCP